MSAGLVNLPQPMSLASLCLEGDCRRPCSGSGECFGVARSKVSSRSGEHGGLEGTPSDPCCAVPLGKSIVAGRARGIGVSIARKPCSERKFQSHPTVPPGRLIELAFAAVYRV